MSWGFWVSDGVSGTQLFSCFDGVAHLSLQKVKLESRTVTSTCNAQTKASMNPNVRNAIRCDDKMEIRGSL